MSKRLTVKRDGEFHYDIVLEPDFSNLAYEIRKLGINNRKVCIVTDSNVAPLYEKQVREQLESVFSTVTTFIFPAGEEHKNLDTVNGVYEHLIRNQFDRKDILLALGGGVTGDLTGFASATYLRGISFIQVPTTLLAQVDSSIGGKTGVDFAQYKNMVGAFHQPALVYMNINTCKTLPDAEFSCGMGEILKHGLIKHADYYTWTILHMADIWGRPYEQMEEMILRSCEIKKNVVENDPTEKGERALLNFGHTIGHAIEKLMDFNLHHGQCVALGYLAAAYISYRRQMISLEDLEVIRRVNTGFGLPTSFYGLHPKDILSTTKLDKKMEQGQIKFILLKEIGNAYIDLTVTDEEILDAITYINGDKPNE